MTVPIVIAAAWAPRGMVVMVEVVVDHLDRAWWAHYLATLRQRFQQDEIHARAVPAQML